MDVANRLGIVRPAFLVLGVAVKQSADQRTCFVNSAEPRLPVEETAREFVLPVVQQIADEFFRPASGCSEVFDFTGRQKLSVIIRLDVCLCHVSNGENLNCSATKTPPGLAGPVAF